MTRTFVAAPAVRGEEPLLIGVIGPPGGGKTLSSLKLAKGMQSVRGGDIIVIDTEAGRSRKYNDLVPFKIVEFEGQARSEDFLEAIKQQLPLNPAAIIVDSLSDEHEAYLEWHDAEVPKFGGNEWAAWSKPKASRKKLISGILRIKTPLIFTFRAREKTKQNPDAKSAKDKIVNIGWQPVAPLEIVHTLDLTCILPPRADGVPTWKSDKVGEDFIIKLPNYLAPYITEGTALNETMGAAFAKWARGDVAKVPDAAHDPNEYSSRAYIESSDAEGIANLKAMAREAAERGSAVFKVFYSNRTKADQAILRGMKTELEALMPKEEAES
jgi:AAA domain